MRGNLAQSQYQVNPYQNIDMTKQNTLSASAYNLPPRADSARTLNSHHMTPDAVTTQQVTAAADQALANIRNNTARSQSHVNSQQSYKNKFLNN